MGFGKVDFVFPSSRIKNFSMAFMASTVLPSQADEIAIMPVSK